MKILSFVISAFLLFAFTIDNQSNLKTNLVSVSKNKNSDYTFLDSNDNSVSSPAQDVSGMFNERGYFSSNSVSYDENEVINDFNGNLNYTFPMYNNKGAGDLNLNLSLNYNGSVNYQSFAGNQSTVLGSNLPRYNISAPGWIFKLNFETNFFTKDVSSNNVSSNNVKLLATGYQITDRLAPVSNGIEDQIMIMRGDGSVLTLRRLTSAEGCNDTTSFENCYVGEYYSDSKGDYTRAKLKFNDGKVYPTYRNRIASVMNGDGLTYVYEEYKNQYYDYPYNLGSFHFKPQVMLLKRIVDRFGHQINIEYTYNLGSQPVYGRPLIKSIEYPGVPGASIYFYYSSGVVYVTNNIAAFRILTTDYNLSPDQGHRAMVNKIINSYDTVNVSYNDYNRTAERVSNPNASGDFMQLNLSFKRISSLKNYNRGERSYEYADGNETVKINMTPASNNKIRSDWPYYKGQGRDLFFTNMLKKKTTINDGVMQKTDSFSYFYSTLNGRSDTLTKPVDSTDNYKTTFITKQVNATYSYQTPTEFKRVINYTDFPLRSYLPVDPDNPDVDGFTKMIMEENFANGSGTAFKKFEYKFKPDEFLDTNIVETINNISRSKSFLYEHSSSPSTNSNNNPLTKVFEYDAYRKRTEKYFIMLYKENIHFAYANYLVSSPLNEQVYDTTQFYELNILDSMKIFSNATEPLYKETMDYLYTNSDTGYMGQNTTKKVFEGGTNNFKKFQLRYYVKDTVGKYLYPVTNTKPSYEGNLKFSIDPNNDTGKYYYDIVTNNNTNTDEPPGPRLNYFTLFEDNTTGENNSRWYDQRMPTIIVNSPKAGYELKNYKIYNTAGNVLKDLNNYRYETEFAYDALQRIERVALPGDFLTGGAHNTYLILRDTTLTFKEYVIGSVEWGKFNANLSTWIKGTDYFFNTNPRISPYLDFELDKYIDGGYPDNPTVNILPLVKFGADNVSSNIIELKYAYLVYYPNNFTVRFNNHETPIDSAKLTINPYTYIGETSSGANTYLHLRSIYGSAQYKPLTKPPPELSGSCTWETDYLYPKNYRIIDIYEQFKNQVIDSDSAWAGISINIGMANGHVDPQPDQEYQINLDICSNATNVGWQEHYSPRILAGGIYRRIDSTKIPVSTSSTLSYLYDDGENKVTTLARQSDYSAIKKEYLFDGFYNIKQSRNYTSATEFDSSAIKYNYLGLKAQIKDPIGNIVKTGYDELLNVDSTSNPDTSYTFQYDAYQNNLTYYFGTVSGFINKKTFKDELGHMFEKYYDAVGNLRREVKFIDGEPNIESNSTGSLITDYRYDSSYRVSKVKTPEGKIIHYYYDGYGRQSQRITPDAGLTSYFYDKNDNLIFSQDANQKAVDQFKYTFRNYDGLNRLTGIGEKIFEIDAPSDGSQYNSSTDAYYLTINVYDTIANSIVSNLFFTPSGYTSPLYTKGNLAATAYRTKTSDNWNCKYYKYDVRGRVIKMWNIIADFDTLTTEYIYNSQDQITFLYYQSGKADSKSYYYEYDYTGRLKNTSYYTGPPSDNPIDYTNLASYDYNKNSQVSNQNFNGNTLENTYSYNSRNWITLMESSNNIFNYENGYFKNGNVKTQTLSGNYNDSFANNVNLNFSYTYDKSNRLLQSEKGSSYKLINTYDKDGNILTLKRYGATANRIDSFNYVYNSGANRLNRVTGSISQYTYDANGNMISDNLNKNNYVRYDYRNLIIELLHHSYTTHDTLLITRYNYDEAGNRVRKLIYKHITHPFDPEPENPEEELDVSDTQYWTFVKEEIYSRDVSGREMAIYVNGGIDEYPIYGLDMIGKLKNDVPNYYFKDHLGSVRAIVNSSNQLVSAQDYDAWGYLLQSRIYASDESKFKFTEKERDKESNYDYFGARYYDSRIGRFNGSEPIPSSSFGWSSFVYCADNPLRVIDPTGEEWYYIYDDPKSGNWQFFENTPSQEVWAGKYDNQGNKVMEMKQGYKELLHYQGRQLQWLMENGNVESWKGISGIPDLQGQTQIDKQSEKNEGPIPEGWWYVDPSESKSITRPDDIFDFIKWIFKDKAYGGWYTAIHPTSGTETYGRSGFQLHGGWDYGSIGCIDLATQIRDFSVKFETHNKVMLLFIDYSKSKK